MDDLTITQHEVYDTLRNFGPLPDVALVPIAQHVLNVRQASSGIRTRRHELVEKGLVREVGTMRLPSGREAKVWDAS